MRTCVYLLILCLCLLVLGEQVHVHGPYASTLTNFFLNIYWANCWFDTYLHVSVCTSFCTCLPLSLQASSLYRIDVLLPFPFARASTCLLPICPLTLFPQTCFSTCLNLLLSLVHLSVMLFGVFPALCLCLMFILLQTWPYYIHQCNLNPTKNEI